MTEPTFPDLDPIRGNQECDDARYWMAWAKARLAELETENLRLVRERDEAVNSVVPKEKKIQELEKGIEGLKAWVAASKPNVQVYGPGSKVYLIHDTEESDPNMITATVDTVCVSEDRVRYWVYWWSNGTRHEELVNEEEIIRSTDTLPITHMRGVQYR